LIEPDESPRLFTSSRQVIYVPNREDASVHGSGYPERTLYEFTASKSIQLFYFLQEGMYKIPQSFTLK
jgi:hypothetical protein